MRFARKVALFSIVVVTALASSMSSAFATNAVEVVDESTGVHCSTPTVSKHMVTGGCHLNVDGQEVQMSGHIFGVESLVLTCDHTFDLYIGENATGYMTNMSVTQGGHGDPDCDGYRPCISEGAHAETHPSDEGLVSPTGNEAGEHAWAFRMERTGTNIYHGQVNMCFHTFESIEECEGALDLTITEANEDLFEAVPMPSMTGNMTDGGSLPEDVGQFSTHCEIKAHYDLTEETGQDLHIN